MREFYSTIFMGNGIKSTERVERLVSKLRDAIHTHSGLQQGQAFIPDSMMTKDKQEIIDTVEDIKAALNIPDYKNPTKEVMLDHLGVLLGKDGSGTITPREIETKRHLINTMLQLGYLTNEEPPKKEVERPKTYVVQNWWSHISDDTKYTIRMKLMGGDYMISDEVLIDLYMKYDGKCPPINDFT